MAVDRREILQRVASGDLSPEDADRLLRETSDEPIAPPPPAPDDVHRVRVSASVGGIEVVGDESVAQAEVEGPHRADVSDGTLTIHGDWDSSEGFSIRLGRHGRRRGFVHMDPRRAGDRTLPRLRLRLNPALDVDV
jgi:hypothetical protein